MNKKILPLVLAIHLILSACSNQAVNKDKDNKVVAKPAHKQTIPYYGNSWLLSRQRIRPEDHAQLWTRITARFYLKYDKKHPLVQKYIQQYNQYHISGLISRAEPFLHFIIEELEKRNMPAEIAFIPMIESSFNPIAVSSMGCRGIWQILGDTGARFGIKHNDWFDGSVDIAESTRTALNYLSYLHTYFNGDWMLAIAAYNSGEGWVKRAIKENQANGKKIRYWDLKLPQETTNYLPRLLALTSIIEDPQRHAIQLPLLANKAPLTKIDLSTPIDLAVAAKLANISLKELLTYNPGHKKWATDKKSHLFIPTPNINLFHEGLAKAKINKTALISKQYKIKHGDNLSVIAKKFKVSVNILRERNNLRNDMIVVGNYLFIPFHI